MKFFAPFVRIYFNRSSDAPKIWSVDFGPDTAEINCAWVSVSAPFATGDDSAVPPGDKQRAKAWLFANNVEVEISGASISIRPSA